MIRPQSLAEDRVIVGDQDADLIAHARAPCAAERLIRTRHRRPTARGRFNRVGPAQHVHAFCEPLQAEAAAIGRSGIRALEANPWPLSRIVIST